MAEVVVTGAAGFIGSHVARFLEFRGLDIVRSDLRIPEQEEGTWQRADLTRMPDLLELTLDADAVVHIGGIGDTYLAAQDPRLAFGTNARGTLNLLEAARRSDVRRFVYASSWEVYGPAVYEPVDERHRCFPEHPYSLSKLAGDMHVQNFGRHSSLRTVVLRLGTTYGPGMRETAVIPAFLLKALRKEQIEIQGGGQQFRQFTHVSDIARAFYLALLAQDPDPVYNIVSQEQTTIRGLADMISKLIPAEIVQRDARLGDPPSVVISSQLAADRLGWVPEVPFDEGLRSFAADYLRFPVVIEDEPTKLEAEGQGVTRALSVTRPRGLTFGATVRGPGPSVRIPVASIEPATPTEDFRFVVSAGNHASPPTVVPNGGKVASAPVNGAVYCLTWIDANRNELVDAGDSFQLTLRSGTWPSPGTLMRLNIFFKDGWPLAVVDWNA